MNSICVVSESMYYVETPNG